MMKKYIRQLQKKFLKIMLVVGLKEEWSGDQELWAIDQFLLTQ